MTPSSVIAWLRTPGITRTVLALLGLGFVLLAVVGGVSIWSAGQTRAFNALVDHTHTVIEASQEISNLVLEAETGQRGYAVTQNSDYLERYAPAVAVLPSRLDQLQELVADNPEQEGRARQLARAVEARISTLRQGVSLTRQGRNDEALILIRSGQGRGEMTAVRDLTAQMQAAERALLAGRAYDARRSNDLTIAVDLASLALIALVALASVLVIRRYLLELRESRAELDKLNRGLEETVAERTEDLVRANEEIQRFAYIVSHDLRAPLVNVMGYTSELQTASKCFEQQLQAIEAKAPELVDKDAVTAVREDAPEAIDFIRASTAKMDRLINAILKLSREGRRVLVPERIDMTAAMQAIANSLHHQTGEANARIEIEPLPVLVSDRLSIDQVFSNLLDNAVKFLDRSRPGLITVSGEESGPFVIYRVADNGRGIAAKDRERVFELFRRAGAQDRPGEGLGLAFVKNSVRRLGGMMELQSEPGQGSTFTLKFPKALSVLPGNAE